MVDELKEKKDRLGISRGKGFEKVGRRRRKPSGRTLLSYFGGEGGGGGGGGSSTSDITLEEKDDRKGTIDLGHHEMVEEYDDNAHTVRYDGDELQSTENRNNDEGGVVMINTEPNEKPAITSMNGGGDLPMNNKLKCHIANPQLQETIVIEEGGGKTTLDSTAVDVIDKSCDEICKQQSSTISLPNRVTEQTTRLVAVRQNEKGSEEESDLNLRTASKEEEYLLQPAGNPFFLAMKQKKKLMMLLDNKRIEADRQKTARSLASFKETNMHRSIAPLFERRTRQPSIHKSTKRKAWTLLDFPTLIDNSIIPILTSEKNVATSELHDQLPAAVLHNDGSPSLTRRRKMLQTPHLFKPHFDSYDFELTTLLRGHPPSPSVARQLFGCGGGDNNCHLRKNSNLMWDLVGKDSVMALGMACGLSLESSASSIDRYEEMRRRSAADSLWTEVYRPQMTSDICGNSGCVKSLLDWLDQCKARLMRRHGCKPPCGSVGEETEVRGRSSSEESLAWSTDGIEEDCELPTATLLVGPVGVGKTTTVYACAAAAGYTIIEVNASCSRSGTAIRKMFGEAAQSQRLGLASSRKTMSSPRPDIIDMTDSATSEVTSVGHKMTPTTCGNVKRKAKESGGGFFYGYVGNGNHEDNHTSNPGCTPAAGTNDNGDESLSSYRSSNLPKLTVILVEEIDVVTEEDAGFAVALKNLRADAKVPVIFTATSAASVNYIIDRNISVLNMRKARICEVARVIASIAHAERLSLHAQACINLAQYFHLDVRRCVLALQGWSKDLTSACLLEDEGTGSIGGEAGAAWIAFDSVERSADNRFCQLLPNVQHPHITRLDPSIVPCGGSSSHCVVVKGLGFLHPPVGVGDLEHDRMTTACYAAPVSVICGHDTVPCNLISDSEIEAWVPAHSIAGGVKMTVLVGAGENVPAGTSSSKRNWLLRSDACSLSSCAVLCYQHAPRQQSGELLLQKERKKSSKAQIGSGIFNETEPLPPKRRSRYAIESDENVGNGNGDDVEATTKTAVYGESNEFRVEREDPTTTVLKYYEDNISSSNNAAVPINDVMSNTGGDGASMKPVKDSSSSICEQPSDSQHHQYKTQKRSKNRALSESGEVEDGEEEEVEFDGTASSSDTTAPLSVISSTSSSQPQDVTGSKATKQHCSLDMTPPYVKCTAAPIRAESYPRPTQKQVVEFRLLGGELGECWSLSDAFSTSDIILTGCTPQEDGNNFRVVVPNPIRLRYPWDLSDAGEGSYKDTSGRDYEGGAGSPWPLVPSGPYIARDLWTLALKKSDRKVKNSAIDLTLAENMRSGIAGEEERRVLPCQLQSQCLLGRSRWFRRNDRFDYFCNALERLKHYCPSCSFYLTPEACTDLLPTLHSLSNCSMFHRGFQLRHTRSRTTREIENVGAGDAAGNLYLLHTNTVQTVQDVQLLQGMYNQEAW